MPPTTAQLTPQTAGPWSYLQRSGAARRLARTLGGHPAEAARTGQEPARQLPALLRRLSINPQAALGPPLQAAPPSLTRRDGVSPRPACSRPVLRLLARSGHGAVSWCSRTTPPGRSGSQPASLNETAGRCSRSSWCSSSRSCCANTFWFWVAPHDRSPRNARAARAKRIPEPGFFAVRVRSTSPLEIFPWLLRAGPCARRDGDLSLRYGCGGVRLDGAFHNHFHVARSTG